VSRRLPLALVLGTHLAGCATAPPRAEAPGLPEPPAAWAAGEVPPGELAPEWWRDLGDPGLDRVVTRALEGNHDLRATAARVAQAAEQARIAGADPLPQLSFSGDGSRSKQNFVGFPIPGSESGVLSTTSSRYGVSLQSSWEVDLWGRLSAASQAGLAELQAASATWAGARLSLAGQTAKAWLAVAESVEQLELARATARSFRETESQVRSRFERGLSPSLELRLAIANLEEAEALVATRERQLDAGRRQLEVLQGLYPSAAQALPERLPGLPAAVPAGLPAELIARRPDLAAAERRLAAAGARTASARRSLYPRLSLSASAGTSTGALEKLVDGDFSVWSLVGNLLQPLFQGGRLRAGVSLAEAVEDEQLASFVQTALQAYAEVETALASEERLVRATRHLEAAAEQSQSAQELAESRYRSGLSDFITVLESQRRALQAQGEQIATQRQALDNRIDLYLALGGGFEAPAPDGETRASLQGALP
jgi:NodT family efflux transporter outer membrane factor (OMF) lipoprotein